MSAPSKEEIAEMVAGRRAFLTATNGLAANRFDKALVVLADENERLRADVDKTQNEFARSARAWTAERDKLMADAIMRQTTEITLRADLAAMTASFDEAAGHLTRLMDERAECSALLSGLGYQATDYCDGAEEGEDMSEECYDEKPCWAHRAAALLAKLRGQP